MDGKQVLLLQVGGGAVYAFQDDAREADDGIERRAQFVAHVGQELTLEAVGFAHFLDGLHREFVGTRVVNGDGDLVGEALKHGDIVFAKGIDLGGLNVQRADGAGTYSQGQGGLRAGLRQERVEFVGFAGGGVVDNDGAPAFGHSANDGFGADLQAVLLAQHFRAGLARGGLQDGLEAGFFGDEDTGVVKAKSVAHQVHGPREERGHVQCGGDQPPDLGRRKEIFVAALEGLFSFFAVGDVTHGAAKTSDASIGSFYQRHGRFDRSQRSILARHIPVEGLFRNPRSEDPVIGLEDSFCLLRGHELAIVHPNHFIRGASE